MRISLVLATGFFLLASYASADEPQAYLGLYNLDRVETDTISIRLDSVRDEVHFAITLRDKDTGLERRHEFVGEGAPDPAPFQLEYLSYCDTKTILLTIEFPWRHALPQYVRVLSTFAFRESDFAFIDVFSGPLTDIALADDTAYDPADLDMLPQIRVRCLVGRNGKPFEFFEQEAE